MGTNDILDELEEMKPVEEFETEISMLGREFNSIPETKKKPVAELLARSHSGFKRIPPDHLTPDMINMEKHRLCEKGDVPGEIASGPYPELVKYLLAEGKIFFFTVHPAFITRELLLNTFKTAKGGRITTAQSIEKFAHLIDSEVADAMVRVSIKYLLYINDASLFSDNALLEAIHKEPDSCDLLLMGGKKHILEQAVSEGMWVSSLPKPKSLQEGIKLRMNQKRGSTSRICCLNVYLSSFPPDEVIPLMKSESRRKVLLDLYPSDVLLKLMPEDNFVKGALLDRSLGL